MPVTAGTYTMGPQNAELLVNTRRSGAAAKAGHDLLIEVTSWSGTLEVGEGPDASSVSLTADGASLRVRKGTGGVKSLDEEDRQNIRQTIDEEVLRRTPIEFRSNAVVVGAGGERIQVQGELELLGRKAPSSVELAVDQQGRLTGTAKLRQTDWGIKPYSALFGALQVADELEVTVDANLRSL